MSALPPIATAKADIRKRSCLLYSRKRTCTVQEAMSASGQKRTFAECRNGKTTSRWSLRNLFRCACHVLEERSLEITSSPHFLGLLKEAIGYPREILLCRGIRR